MTMTSSPIKHAVLRPDQLKSHDRGGGARTTPLVLPSVGAQSFINGITEFAPGTAIPFHSHNCEESVMLLSGHAYLDIDSEVHELKPLDTTWIPPNLPHRLLFSPRAVALFLSLLRSALSGTATFCVEYVLR